ncbi:Hsp20/alpha crystallin family protein [Luteolibacter yonseiensis]|uniref:Hsp20/alpha crystallin family protein n=1 Tax=Luteolibacter yonseiensis TaxID=1144680 RepID=A0A934VD27_9BACT|nr:Hsp20/alpha crystallin family protein [Luteolibacter yonseiensis]MBK1817730.1 Hsp20/alpha crystallin family protein [Luteolibacter yonseiensis]
MSNCQCPTETAAVRPQFRTREDENGATLQIALPGVRKEDINLTLHESSLRIDATRGDTVPEDWKTHRDTGAVQRYGLDIRLTNRLDGTKTTATIDAGVLTLQVPLREESKPRQIAVN